MTANSLFNRGSNDIIPGFCLAKWHAEKHWCDNDGNDQETPTLLRCLSFHFINIINISANFQTKIQHLFCQWKYLFQNIQHEKLQNYGCGWKRTGDGNEELVARRHAWTAHNSSTDNGNSLRSVFYQSGQCATSKDGQINVDVFELLSFKPQKYDLTHEFSDIC